MSAVASFGTRAQFFWLWFRIGWISFGGPAGQIALMHRIFVDEKRWLGERRFLHALNYCMLLPGPEAQQLATYIGWLAHGIWGGVVAGVLFVLPGALVMLALSITYVLAAGLEPVQGLLFGLKAAVLAVVAQAVLRLGRRVLKTPELVLLAAAAFIAIFVFNLPFPIVVLGAAAIGLAGGLIAPRRWAVLSPEGGDDASGTAAETASPAKASLSGALRVMLVCGALWAGPVLFLGWLFGWTSSFAQMATFFSGMAVVSFGGAYAVLAYVAQEAVATYGWVTPQEMLHGLGLAEARPGPLVIVLQFVGFLGAYRDAEGLPPLVAGMLGAAVTTWVTFVPSFLWIFLGAPFVERLRNAKALTAGLSAITAAVVGVILNLALWFGLHVAFGTVTETAIGPARLWTPDPSTVNAMAVVLAVAAFLALERLKLNLLLVLAAAALAGLAYTVRF